MKKITSMFLVILMVATSMITSIAAENNVTSRHVEDDEFDFSSFIAELKENKQNFSVPSLKESRTVTYKFFDMNGKDVTDSFSTQIRSVVDEDKLYKMYLDNIGYAVKRTETITRAGDLTKTVEEEIDRACIAISGDIDFANVPEEHRNGRVFYRLRGAVTYNPNTYKITSASPVYRSYLSWSGWGEFTRPYTTHEISETPKIATNGYSATFNHSMKISAHYGPEGAGLGTFEYGTFSHTFKIEVN